MAGEVFEAGRPRSNWFATTDPSATDDDAHGYCCGSMWANLTAKTVWLCFDNTTNTAEWVQVGPSRVSAGTLWQYRAKTGATSGYPGNGYLLWDNATQTSATHLLISHLTDDNLDVDILLGTLGNTNTVLLQDANDSANFQKWTLTGSGVNTNPGASNSYWTFPVTLASSGGTGSTGFPNNHQLAVFVIR